VRSFKLYGVAAYGIVLALGGLALASPPEGGYHLLNKYDLGAAPGGQEYWDYITFDTATSRLYISHLTEVKVVDADSGTVVGSIPDLKRVQSIALASDLGRGFISDGGARNMALDPKTHKLFIDTADFSPTAAPAADQPKPQPTPTSGTFRLLVYGR
jgi:hypothetical protein